MDSGILRSVEFLKEATRLYSDKCPQLGAYFGSKVDATLKKIGGVESSKLCPHCCTILSPSNTNTRILSAQKLKRKRRLCQVKGHHVHSFAPKHCRVYVVVHCKSCRRDVIVDGFAGPDKVKGHSHHLSIGSFDHKCHVTPTPSTPVHTPLHHSRLTTHTGKTTPTGRSSHQKRSSNKKKSGCSLKASLNHSQTLKQQQTTTSSAASPKLTAFLTSCN